MTTIQSTDRVFFFSVNVPYLQCEALYSQASLVMIAEDGTSVRVPSNRIKKFITSEGIKGRFRMIVDKHKKIKSFERIR